MRRIDDDQPRHIVWVLYRQAQRHRAAPIMRHDHPRPRAKVVDELTQVLNQMFRAIFFYVGRFIGKIVAAHIERDGAVRAGEFLELISPRVPEFGEAMDEQNDRAVAGSDVVQADSVYVGVVVVHGGAPIDVRKFDHTRGTTGPTHKKWPDSY